MIYDYFENIKVGDKIVSRARTVTETDVVTFMMFTGNWESIHSDAEHVKKTPYGQRLVQGTLVFALGPGLLPIGMPGGIIAFYGVDKIRFIKPVFIGDTIHVEREIIGKEEKRPDAGVVSCQMTFKNQRDEVVQVNIMKLLVAKRPVQQKEA